MSILASYLEFFPHKSQPLFLADYYSEVSGAGLGVDDDDCKVLTRDSNDIRSAW